MKGVRMYKDIETMIADQIRDLLKKMNSADPGTRKLLSSTVAELIVALKNLQRAP
jgi:hypothetical protein